MRVLGRFGRILGWAAGYVLGLAALVLAGAWVWWQPEPQARGTEANALWARHQWVGEPHSDAEYRALGELLKENRITDVFFHAGPFEADGTVPEAKYRYARQLLAAVHEYAPGVRAQAYLGQIRVVDGKGVIDLDDPAVRARVLRTDAAFLDLGFDGIHYDFEPIYPDDRAFLALMDATRELTRSKGKLVSVALEQQTLLDAGQPVYKALLPRTGKFHYPPRPTQDFLRAVADRADQVAIMTYDVSLPTRSLAAGTSPGTPARRWSSSATARRSSWASPPTGPSWTGRRTCPAPCAASGAESRISSGRPGGRTASACTRTGRRARPNGHVIAPPGYPERQEVLAAEKPLLRRSETRVSPGKKGWIPAQSRG
ncbi:hypothetical protein ACFQY7_54840 [Actinomadura luteofluorescens]|uniref:hypothetical protein n=1 Tax=Actinomadura luteofluorescens TaxID=46163 RepID=UPI00362A05C4